MKFKNYLEESHREMEDLIANRSIPLDPGLMRRLGYYEEDVMAWHLTNVMHLNEMVKQQNKRNTHLSTFTVSGPELARLPSQPNVLLKLKGDSVIGGDTDLWTNRGPRGRRWLDIRDRKLTKGDSKKLTFHVSGVLQKIFNEYQIDIDVAKSTTGEILSKIRDYRELNKKDITRIYKKYLEGMEKMLNREYKELNKYLRGAAEMEYNEVVLTKWKIVEVYSIDYESPSVVSIINKLNLPYKGVISIRDIPSLK